MKGQIRGKRVNCQFDEVRNATLSLHQDVIGWTGWSVTISVNLSPEFLWYRPEELTFFVRYFTPRLTGGGRLSVGKCANRVSNVPSVWTYVTWREGGKKWTLSIRSCQVPNLRERGLLELAANMCFSSLVWIFFFFACLPDCLIALFLLRLCQPGGLIRKSSWGQGEELVSKPGWFTGSSDLLYVSPANGASLAASLEVDKRGSRQGA